MKSSTFPHWNIFNVMQALRCVIVLFSRARLCRKYPPGETAYLQISLRPLAVFSAERDEVTLENAQQAIGTTQTKPVMAALGGQALYATTRAGRAVEARYLLGSDRAVMISAGQHANETSGVVGRCVLPNNCTGSLGLTLSSRR